LECGGLKPLGILPTPTIQSCAKPPRSQVGRTSTTPAAGPWERLEESIIRCHLRFLAALGDSHITRRCGLEIADEARRRAAHVLNGEESLESFDAWLRTDGHRRNPGSCADLVAASLYVALRQGMIKFP